VPGTVCPAERRGEERRHQRIMGIKEKKD